LATTLERGGPIKCDDTTSEHWAAANATTQ